MTIVHNTEDEISIGYRRRKSSLSNLGIFVRE